jgi:hypothetical protein
VPRTVQQGSLELEWETLPDDWPCSGLGGQCAAEPKKLASNTGGECDEYYGERKAGEKGKKDKCGGAQKVADDNS